MRLGLMIGSDKERARGDRLAGLIEDAVSAEAAGFASFWIPQVPGYLDAMTAVALAGAATRRSNWDGDRSAADPSPDHIRAAGPDDARGVPGPVRASVSDRRTTGSSSDQLGCPTTVRLTWFATTSTCSMRRSPDPGPVDVENDGYRVHSPMDVAETGVAPDSLAALGPDDVAHRR